METVQPFNWERIFLGTEIDHLFMLEIGFRVIFIYLFAVFVIRYMGSRGNGSMSVFENVMIIALGSATGDSMFYPKVPLFYACIVITVIVILTRIIQTVQLRSKKINTFLDGHPIVLVKNGELVREGMESARIREDEIFGLLRTKEIENTGEVKYCFIERSGEISVFKFPEGEKVHGLSTFPETLD